MSQPDPHSRPRRLTILAEAELPRDLPFEAVPGLEISAAAGDGKDAAPPRFTSCPRSSCS